MSPAPMIRATPCATRLESVPEGAVRGRVRRLRVHQRRTRGEGDVEHRRDRGRVVLAVLVHRHDPVRARARHARERRGVLPEVARQPDRPDVSVPVREVTYGDVGRSGPESWTRTTSLTRKRMAARRMPARREPVDPRAAPGAWSRRGRPVPRPRRCGWQNGAPFRGHRGQPDSRRVQLI